MEGTQVSTIHMHHNMFKRILNLADDMVKLGYWYLRFLEFNFEKVDRDGSKGEAADTFWRLQTARVDGMPLGYDVLVRKIEILDTTSVQEGQVDITRKSTNMIMKSNFMDNKSAYCIYENCNPVNMYCNKPCPRCKQH